MCKSNFRNSAINIKIIILVLVVIVFGIIVFLIIKQKSAPINNLTDNLLPTNTNQDATKIPAPNNLPLLEAPIDRALERVTKKPFGIDVSPNNSPVSPEKFTGYHTGVDFETFPDEQDKEVVIYAICSGPLLTKRSASGYGGVVIQKCELENQVITVIYGHLQLASVSAKIEEKLFTKSKIGILGKGYSAETSGERKHLHLGIHKGLAVNILGYVQKKVELNNWIDAMKYLK